MATRGLSLEIVTPRGVELREDGLAAVVVHRREAAFETGSEVVILPGHAPMLLELPRERSAMRYEWQGVRKALEVDGGFVEVLDGVVTVVARGCRG